MTKYGPIICNPESEEAKKLVGKKIVGGWTYKTLENMPDELIETTLTRICDSKNPFEVDGSKFTFIREVIEEKPKYRPYEDTEEMVEDYKKRFKDKIVTSPIEMPMIWLKTKSGWKTFASGYGVYSVEMNDAPLTLNELFKDYTYLDGSPVGKEEA